MRRTLAVVAVSLSCLARVRVTRWTVVIKGSEGIVLQINRTKFFKILSPNTWLSFRLELALVV